MKELDDDDEEKTETLYRKLIGRSSRKTTSVSCVNCGPGSRHASLSLSVLLSVPFWDQNQLVCFGVTDVFHKLFSMCCPAHNTL